MEVDPVGRRLRTDAIGVQVVAGVEGRQGPVGDVGITDGGFEDSAAPDQVVDELTYGVVVPPMTRMPRTWTRHDLAVRERPRGGSCPGEVAPDA